jgi:hypothetical protein
VTPGTAAPVPADDGAEAPDAGAAEVGVTAALAADTPADPLLLFEEEHAARRVPTTSRQSAAQRIGTRT